jgi:hypothetical protein
MGKNFQLKKLNTFWMLLVSGYSMFLGLKKRNMGPRLAFVGESFSKSDSPLDKSAVSESN